MGHKTDCICAFCERVRGDIEAVADKERLDALAAYVNAHGALVIHTGYADCGKHSGLGLRPGTLTRTLRQAIDQSLRGVR